MLTSWLTPLVVSALGFALSHPLAAADEWDARVDAIMESYETDDFIGEMSQIAIYGLVDSEANLIEDKYRNAVGTIQNITMEENGGHPMIFGLDSVHGTALVSGAVKFGQEINGAASFNPDLVYEMGRITSRDTLAAGILWSFAPILDKSSNLLWARTYETFGEDPYTISVMADASVRGMQSINGSAACLKHFIAYSDTRTGHDKQGVILTDFDLPNYFAPQFKAGFDAGALTTIENYISVNGVPTIANTKLMTELLRTYFAFEGVSVSDYVEINQLTDFHRTARSEDEATRKSAHRVVKLKVKVGLYDNAMPGKEYLDLVGNDDDVAAALEIA
ncbi:unnamed protein product [Phytophthora lilii]|uniref:beta-glucosidase n=1 Tax=Phytophthora lilii TaxID=2077276 RepID=A0A9W7CLG4_9STRA|nr:unnamed protein product [Phytophthora lilii]